MRVTARSSCIEVGARWVVALEYDPGAVRTRLAYPWVKMRANLAGFRPWPPRRRRPRVPRFLALRAFLRDCARGAPGGSVVVFTPNRLVFSPRPARR